MNDPDSASHHDFFGVVPAPSQSSDTDQSVAEQTDTDLAGSEPANPEQSGLGAAATSAPDGLIQNADQEPPAASRPADMSSASESAPRGQHPTAAPEPASSSDSPQTTSAATTSSSPAHGGAQASLPPIVPPQQLRFSAPRRPHPQPPAPDTFFADTATSNQIGDCPPSDPNQDSLRHDQTATSETTDRPTAPRDSHEAIPHADVQNTPEASPTPEASSASPQLPTQTIPSWVVTSSPHLPQQPTTTEARSPQARTEPPATASPDTPGDSGAVPALVSLSPTADTAHCEPAPASPPPQAHQLHATLPPPQLQADHDQATLDHNAASAVHATSMTSPPQAGNPPQPAATPQLPGGGAAHDRLPSAQTHQPADNSPRDPSQPRHDTPPGPGPHQPTPAAAPDVPFGTPPSAASTNRQGASGVTLGTPNTSNNTDRGGRNTATDDTDGLAVVQNAPANPAEVTGATTTNNTKVAQSPADVAGQQLLSPLHDTIDYESDEFEEPADTTNEPTETNTEKTGETKPSRPAWLELLREVGIVVGAALLISLTIKTFLFQMFFIPSPSMSTTLAIGDRVVVSQLTPGLTDLKRGDIIVFKDPGNWLPPKENQPEGPWTKATTSVLTFVGILPNDNGQHLIKRIVGMPGDVVTCCDADGKIRINGEPVDEPYLRAGSMPSEVAFEIHVPKDRYWVLGDNRQQSKDSRYNMDQQGFGTVPHSEVVGRAVMIAWPAGRWTWLGNYSETWARVPKPTNTPATAKTAGPDQGAEQKP